MSKTPKPFKDPFQKAMDEATDGQQLTNQIKWDEPKRVTGNLTEKEPRIFGKGKTNEQQNFRYTIQDPLTKEEQFFYGTLLLNRKLKKVEIDEYIGIRYYGVDGQTKIFRVWVSRMGKTIEL